MPQDRFQEDRRSRLGWPLASLAAALIAAAGLAHAAQSEHQPESPADSPEFAQAEVAQAEVISNVAGDASDADDDGSRRRFGSIYELNAWFTYYYQNPEPEFVPAYIRSTVEEGVVGNPVGLAMCASFLREVVQDHPEMIDVWYAEFADASETERWLLWNAIWWSGVEESKPFFERIRDSVSERDRTEAIDPFIATDPTELRDEVIENDVVMRCMVEAFHASGDLAYADRIIQEIDAPPLDVLNPVVRQGGFMMPAERVFRAAQSQLERLAHRHSVVHQHVKDSLDSLTPEGRAYVEQVLTRVDERLAIEPTPDPAAGGPGLHAERLNKALPADR